MVTKLHGYVFHEDREKRRMAGASAQARRALATHGPGAADTFKMVTRTRLAKHRESESSATPTGFLRPPGVPGAKRRRPSRHVSVPDLAILAKTLAPYGLARARMHDSWSDFTEPPLPRVAEAPVDWQARVGWAARFEKVAAEMVIDPDKPHLLGRGKSGHVVRMRERATGRDVAVKKFQNIDGRPGDAARRARNEFDVAHLLRHPRVVAPLDIAVDEDRGKAFLVYRLVEGKTLANIGMLPERVARQVLRDIAEALAYLFAEKVTHNDLHGNNIMVHKGRGYLIDLGLAGAGADVLYKLDLQMFCATMAHFYPSVRSPEARRFFHWFKKKLTPRNVDGLIEEVLAHPYLHGTQSVAGERGPVVRAANCDT